MAGKKENDRELDMNRYIAFLANRIEKRKNKTGKGKIGLWRVKWKKMIWLIEEFRPAIESPLLQGAICTINPSLEKNPADYTMEDLQFTDSEREDINTNLHYVIEHTDDDSVYNYDSEDDEDDPSISPYITPIDYTFVK